MWAQPRGWGRWQPNIFDPRLKGRMRTPQPFPISFEFFPPKTPVGEEKLKQVRVELYAARPAFFSVTYGAGGSTQDGTLQQVQAILADGHDAAPHFSCIGATRDSVRAQLAQFKAAGIRRMVALRGAGLTLFLAAAAALIALVTYASDDASLNNANVRDVANWLGPLGAVAADLMLQIFGLAATAFLAPLFVWGARALRGKSLKYAMWRLVAWCAG